jgi:hypothetical protein
MKHRDSKDDTDLRFNLHRLIMADETLSELGKNCASVLLFGFMNGTTGRCDPTYEKIGRALGGKDRRTAMRGVRALVTAGWVAPRHTFRKATGSTCHGSNVFEFAFDRLSRLPAEAAPTVPEGGGVRTDTTPGDETVTTLVSISSPGVVSELSPKQRKDNKEIEQGSLFGDDQVLEAACAVHPNDNRSWFRTQWYPIYPKQEDEDRGADECDKVLRTGRATRRQLIIGVRNWRTMFEQNPEPYPKKYWHLIGPARWFRDGRWKDKPRPAPTNFEPDRSVRRSASVNALLRHRNGGG